MLTQVKLITPVNVYDIYKSGETERTATCRIFTLGLRLFSTKYIHLKSLEYKTTFLDVVIRKSTSVLKLLASEDQPLLVWGDSLLVLDLSLDILDSVRGLHLKGDGLSRQSLDENLHGCCLKQKPAKKVSLVGA